MTAINTSSRRKRAPDSPARAETKRILDNEWEVNLAAQPHEELYSGRVRLPARVFLDEGWLPSQVVRAHLRGQTNTVHCICRAYPHNISASGSMAYVDASVVQFEKDLQSPRIMPSERMLLRLEMLTDVQEAKLLKISMNKPHYVQEFPRKAVRDLIRAHLVNFCIDANCTVKLPTFFPFTQPISIQIRDASPVGYVKVTLNTTIVLDFIEPVKETSTAHLPTQSLIAIGVGDNLPEISGLDEAAKSLQELIIMPLVYGHVLTHLNIECPRGVLLKGPPGVGKTLLVRSLVQKWGLPMVYIDASSISAAYLGESEKRLREAFDDARALALKNAFARLINCSGESEKKESRGGCIVFIDEIDALCPKRDASVGNFETRIVAQLLTLMDGLNPIESGALGGISEGVSVSVIVVAATNRPNAIDPALRRPGRFDREVSIGVPTTDQRFQILQTLMRSIPHQDSISLLALANKCVGYVGADLVALIREAVLHAINREPKCLTLIPEDFEDALSRVIASTRRQDASIEVPETKWEDIGGLEDIKQALRECVEWPMQYGSNMERLGVRPTKGVLLYGPPGCAKTTLVKAAASVSNSSFIMLSGANIYSAYVGDAEATIRDCFKRARLSAPCIVFFDEIDAIVAKRSPASGDSGVQERVLSTLLNEMDGIEQLCGVMLIAATNRIDLIDEALLRPGRFDRLIAVTPPDFSCRRSILSVYLHKLPVSGKEKPALLDYLAANTDSYSGADIECICREAAIIALREDFNATKVSKKHFDCAMQSVRPSITMSSHIDILPPS